MDRVCLEREKHRGKKTLEPPVEETLPPSTITNIIRAEANFLRLPLFALSTKTLGTLDGIECRGKTTRGGQTYQFTFSATRNKATLYPGPLARSAHLAFLSLLTEQGFPLQNPVGWSWRDLCRRMNIQVGGETVRHLKQAITSTVGLLLRSEFALFSKAEGELIQTKEAAMHLYDHAIFVGSPLPDGTVADTNWLWLSDWYLENLNAMFTAPLDYDLWRYFDAKSTIASRLYEFLLLNFYSGTPVLKINYETLAQFLPVRTEKYLSSAKRQLQPAFTFIKKAGIVDGVAWGHGKTGLAQLQLFRGPRLTPATDLPSFDAPSEDFLETVTVKELRDTDPPESTIVKDFYRLWAGEEQHRPTEKERSQARDLLRNHGFAKTKAIIPLAVKQLRDQWPEAKAFGAIAVYLPDVLRQLEKEERRKAREADLDRKLQEEETQRKAKLAEEEAYRAIWATLPETEKQPVRETVLAKNPRLAQQPKLLDRLCMSELARREKTRTAPTAPRAA